MISFWTIGSIKIKKIQSEKFNSKRNKINSTILQEGKKRDWLKEEAFFISQIKSYIKECLNKDIQKLKEYF